MADRHQRDQRRGAAKLVNELVEAGDERQLSRTIARYGRVELLCLDELGYMELDKRGAELLSQVLTEREEKTAVAIASNDSFGGWTKTFTDPGAAPPSWTASPSAGTSSRPAPAATASRTPATSGPRMRDAFPLGPKRPEVELPPWPGTAVVTGPRSGVTFRAWRNDGFIPLIEVLLALGRWIIGAEWRLQDTEFATGWRGSDDLNLMSSHALPTPTVALVDLVSDGVQMIGGELQAFGEPGPSAPYLVIRSVRGDEWDIMSDDKRVLEAVQEVFEAVADLPH